ncbi:MAG: hypothetical protein AAGA85_19390 [Bacteroidota bacterium]
MRACLFVVLISMAFAASAQLKYEKEVRVKPSNVPSAAIAFVDRMQLERKVKWFKETGIDRSSFEAKTKHQGQRLSIEFSVDGRFEDLEVKIGQDDMSGTAHAKVRQYLESAHLFYRIKKVQVQYSGGSDTVWEFFVGGVRSELLIVRYELVVSAKHKGSFAMYEYLFSEEGDFLQRARITLSVTDNIEY